MSTWARGLRQVVLAAVVGAGMGVGSAVHAAAGERPERAAAGQVGQPGQPGSPLARFQDAKAAALEIATEGQKGKVEEIFAQAFEKLKAIRQELGNAPDQRRQMGQRFAEVMQGVRTKLDEVFNPEQREKLKKKLQELFPGSGPMQPGQVLQRLREHMGELNLSEEQKQKLMGMQADLREKMQKLREEMQADRQAAMPKARELMQDVQQKIKDVLTAEQWTKLREKMQADGAVPAEGEKK